MHDVAAADTHEPCHAVHDRDAAGSGNHPERAGLDASNLQALFLV